RLRRRALELLRRDQPVLRRREVIEAHLRLEAVAAEREETMKGRMRARRRELGPQLLARGVRAVRRDRARARYDAEETREGEVVAGHRGEQLPEPRRVRARDHRELRNGQVQLLRTASGDIDADVHALRAGRR